MCRLITFVSAEGGVGKTSIIYELSLRLSKQSLRVCVFDATFGFNVLALKYSNDNAVELKDYLIGKRNIDDIVNRHNRFLSFVKTNDVTFNYEKFSGIIVELIEMLCEEFDYILIDTNFAVDDFIKNILSHVNIKSEIFVVVSDREECVRNVSKLIQYIKINQPTCLIQMILNKGRIIAQTKNKILIKSELEELFKTKIMFVIPKFYKYNYFDNAKGRKKHRRIFNDLCYTIITNKEIDINYQNQYKGIIGGLRKFLYEKFE